jgi:hypothetical protein
MFPNSNSLFNYSPLFPLNSSGEDGSGEISSSVLNDNVCSQPYNSANEHSYASAVSLDFNESVEEKEKFNQRI